MSSTDELPSGASWVPLLHLGDDAWLGMLGTQVFVGDLHGPKREVDPDEPIGLLPCLERPYSVIVEELREREAELSQSLGSLIGRVPLAAIPHAAVESKSNYWADLALGWLAEMPSSEVDVAALETLENADWAAQGVRQRARRLRRESS